ncbi:MAG: hypothetical protein K8I30_22330 [Anaerolineae bacterium]|nr:hypothetical protein [Anaerolineae bacterium]
MRRSTYFFVILGLLLAACGGNASPTAVLPTVDNSANASGSDETREPVTPIGQAATPDFGATQSAEPTDQLQQRAYETDEAVLPLPGTMVAAATPDPDVGLIFDTILFERTGGIAGIPLTIEIRSDGTVTRDGVASAITPDQVTLIDTVLDQLNFFGLQGVFTAPGTSADTYHYAVTVERAGSSRTIRAEDGFVPPELQQFLALLSGIAAP